MIGRAGQTVRAASSVPPRSRRGSRYGGMGVGPAGDHRELICDLGVCSEDARSVRWSRRLHLARGFARKHRGRENARRETKAGFRIDQDRGLLSATSVARPFPATSVARATRRGMTFLEVTLATALLALVTASVFTAINFAVGSQSRHEQLLGAAEVASRVVVMYLDDPDATLAQQNRPMDYGPLRYRWSANWSPITLEADAEAAAQSGIGSGPSLSQLQELTVHVWLSEESGGARDPVQGVPQVSIKRMLDMNPTFRNPDSLEGALESGTLFERITGQGRGGPGGAGGDEGGPGGSDGGGR